MKKIILIDGMMCEHCTKRVKKALEAVAGVSSVEMSLESKTATAQCEDGISEESLRSAVTDAGYTVVSVS